MAKTWNDYLIQIKETIETPVNLGDEPYRKCGIMCWSGQNTDGTWKNEGIQWVYHWKQAQEYIKYSDVNGNYWVKAFFDQKDNRKCPHRLLFSDDETKTNNGYG